MKKLLTLFLFIFIVNFVSADTLINEIMYNPEGRDNNQEFVELYLDNIINLENYIIQDEASQDILETLQFVDNSNYALIVEEGFDYEEIESSVYSIGATIGNGLNNDGDTITIKDTEENIIDEVEYSNEWGAYGNGLSLCKIDNGWQECTSTPGRENNENNDEENEIGYVSRVIDGDTVELENEERVRLIGIDTPERGEYYFEEATERLRELVEGEEVILENDVENRDRYDRLLRYIYFDDLFINLILVEEGFARAYPYDPNLRYEDEFAEAEERARENGLGIWRDEERKDYSKQLEEGWNLISINLDLEDRNIENIFSSLGNNLIMVKDGQGRFFNPEYNYNNLPEFNPLESYLVKINEEVTLELEGYELNLEEQIYEFHEDEWYSFSYLLDEEMPIEEVFEEYMDDIFIIKDGKGKFLSPGYNYNNIRNMIPGNGYMIKPLNDFEFRY